MEINPRSVELLPHVDATLFLAVWHHFVQQFGLEAATAMLSQVWRRTATVLFFETGEQEMEATFGLPPMEPDPRTWLTEYLLTNCDGASVRHLGLHHAGGSGEHVAWRNLFAVIRNPSDRGG